MKTNWIRTNKIKKGFSLGLELDGIINNRKHIVI